MYSQLSIIYSTLNRSLTEIDVLSNKDETFVSELQVFFLFCFVLFIVKLLCDYASVLFSALSFLLSSSIFSLALSKPSIDVGGFCVIK